MSNRQYPSSPWWSKGDRPAGVVHSASHGVTEFHPVAWFKENKVRPCREVKGEDCGIRSTPKHPHFHPAGAS